MVRSGRGVGTGRGRVPGRGWGAWLLALALALGLGPSTRAEAPVVGAFLAVGSAGGAGGGAAPVPLQVVQEVYDLIVRDYAGPVDPEALVQGALAGMAAALGDPFTEYLPPEQAQGFSGTLEGYGGIGVAVLPSPSGPVIDSVAAGGPAYRAGLRSGDLIVAVDGHPTRGLPLSQVADWLRGAPGTRVTLQVQVPERAAPETVTLTRMDILPPSVFGQLLRPGVAWIRITSFTADTAAEFDATYARLRAEAGPGGLKGLLLDLRGNGGGFVSAAAHIAAELAPPGPLFQIVDAHGHVTGYVAGHHPPAPPIVVLVDGGTASAAEILAGALQYRHAAVLVGSRTYGKGSVQELFTLPGGGALKLTVGHDELPDGASWDHVGLQPNVVVAPLPPPWSTVPDFLPVGQRTLEPGMVGLDVLGLQQRLAFLGYRPGPQDGVFDPETEAAVRAFQADHHLRVTGTMGAADWAALGAAMAARVQALQRSPQPDVVLEKGLAVLEGLMAQAARA